VTEHQTRVARYQEALAQHGLAGALLLNAVDVFYLSGTGQNGALWVPAAGEPILLVRKSFARAKAEAGLADVRPFPPSKELAATLGAGGKIGVAFEAVPQGTLDFWRKALPGAELVDAGPILREQRQVKSPAELAVLREGARRMCAVFAQIPSFLRAGLRDLDLSAELECRLRKAGNEGSPRLRAFNAHFFIGLALSGEGAAVPGAFDGPVVGGGLSAANPGGAS
jgi:Xaa-Pro dipeptidase